MKEHRIELNRRIEGLNIGSKGILLIVIALIILLFGLCTVIKIVPKPEQRKTNATKLPSYDLNHIQR